MVNTSAKKYSPQKIEPKWQKKWEIDSFYKAEDFSKKKKYYLLVEFPYPSGAGLHVGHARSWAAMDAYARKKRMEGLNVLYPMGWDSFGLPAENYAIKMGVHPSKIVPKNVAKFKDQCKALGLSFDWTREIDTTDPNYYKWTQWIFVQLFKHGLAYQKEVPVNWCPFCKTNLANEEVLADGRHERCGNLTEKRLQKQWLLRITKYADRLIDDLKLVDFSPKIATQQVNWIGKSKGATVKFSIKVAASSEEIHPSGGVAPAAHPAGEGANMDAKEIEIFTTAHDTIFGVTFIVIAPEIAKKLLNIVPETNKIKVSDYIKASLSKSAIQRADTNKEKTGVEMGFNAINPLNGKEVPVFVADYVLMDYGTGAVMGVPGHDVRDHEFAKKYGLPIKIVIKPTDDIKNRAQVGEDGFWDYLTEIKTKYSDKSILFDSGVLNGLNSEEAKVKLEEILRKNGWGGKISTYHIHDWIFSRQHYWGEPIPMIFCEACAKNGESYFSNVIASEAKQSNTIKGLSLHGVHSNLDWNPNGWFPANEADLPLELPYLEKYQPSGTGESPLASVEEWVRTACPECGGAARRETDTMPNWAGSNWYYLGYLISNQLTANSLQLTANQQPITNNKQQKRNVFLDNKKLINYWMPVDLYQGGFEHTTLHLLYSRFIYKFLFDIGAVRGPEPYMKRRSHGIVLGSDGRKMSKSFGNVVNPDDIVGKYGADTLRLYEAFMGPFEQMIAWSEESLEGCYKFLGRVWRLYMEKIEKRDRDRENKKIDKISSSQISISNLNSQILLIKLHQTIKKVGEDIENMKFNTAVAAMMEFTNVWNDSGNLSSEEAAMFLKILAPFAPHIAEELWEKVGKVEQVDKVEKAGKTQKETFTTPTTCLAGRRAFSTSSTFSSIHSQPWPTYDPKLIVEENMTIVVQINGKVRSQLTIKHPPVGEASQPSTIQSEVEKLAKSDPVIAKWLEGKEIKKTIFVQGKLINFVV